VNDMTETLRHALTTEFSHGCSPAGVVSPPGELPAHRDTHGEPVAGGIDLNRKIRRFPDKDVYRYEKNPKSVI